MLTVSCPFSGKWFALKSVAERFRQLQLATWTRLVVLDNSGDEAFGEALSQEFTSITPKFGDVVWLKESPSRFNGDVAAIYNFLLPYIRGDWLSLEDDVLFESDVYRRFTRLALTEYDVGVISAAMADRNTPGFVLAWQVLEDPEFPNQKVLVPAHPQQRGWSLVGATHMGCTLIRPSAYLGHQFHVKGPYRKIHGQDIHLCMEAALRGIRSATVWDAPAGHLTDRGVMFPMNYPHLTTSPELRRTNPLVSVITPTRARPESLNLLIQQLKRQTHQNYEHLICSDGPDRQSAEVVLQAQDIRHQFYELSFTHGFSGAPQRNAMIQRARGDILVFVDDDAEILPEYLQVMVDLYGEGFSVGFAQIEHRTAEGPQVIPVNRDAVLQFGSIDTLNGFVDASIGKGFFWDLFEDGHDHRYWMSIINYISAAKSSYGFRAQVVGRNSRQYGKSTPPPMGGVALARQLASQLEAPWEPYEDVISQDPEASLTYCMGALGGSRFIRGEATIAKNPKAVLFYSHNILRGQRLEIGERSFEKAPLLAVQYAREIIKGRFPDQTVEQRILSDPVAATEYSLTVVKERLPSAEPVIRQDAQCWQQYRERWRCD